MARFKVRILGGQWQGRSILPPAGIRPMTEMVKQALFHVLGPMDGLSVLDAFAGSGQLGMEALSRGAKFAAFVEKEKSNAGQIRTTLKNFDVPPDSARVLVQDVLAYIQHTKSSFDLILMDPPYEKGLANPAIRAVAGHATLLAAGGRLVLRHTKHEPVDEVPADCLECEFTRCYGDDIVRIWRKK